MPQYFCGRGHSWIDNEPPAGNEFRRCPGCAREEEDEQRKAALHSPLIKAAITEALREFLPELVAALRSTH